MQSPLYHVRHILLPTGWTGMRVSTRAEYFHHEVYGNIHKIKIDWYKCICSIPIHERQSHVQQYGRVLLCKLMLHNFMHHSLKVDDGHLISDITKII